MISLNIIVLQIDPLWHFFIPNFSTTLLKPLQNRQQMRLVGQMFLTLTMARSTHITIQLHRIRISYFSKGLRHKLNDIELKEEINIIDIQTQLSRLKTT